MESYGQLQTLVMGNWQEAIKDLISLLDIFADAKADSLGLAQGRETTERERSSILSGYRRTLSLAGAKATSACLLSRIAKVGPEHRGAARRRAWQRVEQERMEEDRAAHWRAYCRGRREVRGEFVPT